MGTNTSVFALYKPADGESDTVWAPQLNSNCDKLESALNLLMDMVRGDAVTHNAAFVYIDSAAVTIR